MNYYQFHIGDYVSHTAHLTDAEDLAYRRMLDLYYLSEEPFIDPAFVARRVRSTVEIVTTILEEFFDRGSDGWRHARCDDEIAKYRTKADSARKANQIRWSSEKDLKSDLKSDAPQILTNNQEPITNISSLRSDSARDVSKSEKAKRACQLPADFAPGDDHRALAAELGLSLDREWSKFADHHRARGTVFKDWDAALRTWLRKSLDFGTKPGPASAPMAPAALAASKEAHKVFVEEGSEDWFAWKAVRKTIPVVDCRLADGQIKRGWHFPSSRPGSTAGGGFL